MVVDDPTAYVERLEVLIDDKRAERLRRRAAKARIEVLAIAAEQRVVTQMLNDVVERDGKGARASSRDARHRDKSSAPSSRRDIERLRDYLKSKQRELVRKRKAMEDLEGQVRELEALRRRVVMFRFHSAQHFVDCSEDRFALMSASQKESPTLVLRKDGRGWWWYRDRFWWSDSRLSVNDVESSIRESALAGSLHRHLLEEARARTLAPSDSAAAEPISEVVQRAVWGRDLGRCVDCGSTEDLRFEPINHAARNTLSPQDVELRCRTCAVLSAQPGARAWDEDKF